MRAGQGPQQVKLGDEAFVINAFQLSPRSSDVELIVLKSDDRATVFMERMNRPDHRRGRGCGAAGSGVCVLHLPHLHPAAGRLGDRRAGAEPDPRVARAQ